MTEAILIELAQKYGIGFVLTISGIIGIRGAWRAIWPYLRDVYLPERLKAIKEQAAAFKDIAAIVGLIQHQLTGIETRLGKVEEGINEIRLIEAAQASPAAAAPAVPSTGKL